MWPFKKTVEGYLNEKAWISYSIEAQIKYDLKGASEDFYVGIMPSEDETNYENQAFFSNAESPAYMQHVDLTTRDNTNIIRNVDVLVAGLLEARSAWITKENQGLALGSVSEEPGLVIAHAAHRLWDSVTNHNPLDALDYYEILKALKIGITLLDEKKKALDLSEDGLLVEIVKFHSAPVWHDIYFERRPFEEIIKKCPPYFDKKEFETLVREEIENAKSLQDYSEDSQHTFGIRMEASDRIKNAMMEQKGALTTRELGNVGGILLNPIQRDREVIEASMRIVHAMANIAGHSFPPEKSRQ